MIKRLAGEDGTVYWRMEGRARKVGTIYGPPRAMIFDTGVIPVIAMTPSHESAGEEAVWPDRYAPPTFYWADATNGMKYFYVDMSTDPTIPLKDRRTTFTIGRRGILEASYIPSRSEWLKIWQLATWQAKRNGPTPAQGVLYWRVRATDRDRLLTCASAVKTLVIDGGQWTLGPLDLTAPVPTASWSHTGDGIVGFSLELSVDATFEPNPRYTVKVPPRGIADSFYTFRTADLKRLSLLASRAGVTLLHWRVRGEDADRKFVAYSASSTTAAP